MIHTVEAQGHLESIKRKSEQKKVTFAAVAVGIIPDTLEPDASEARRVLIVRVTEKAGAIALTVCRHAGEKKRRRRKPLNPIQHPRGQNRWAVLAAPRIFRAGALKIAPPAGRQVW